MSNLITRRQFAGTVATGALLATWQTARVKDPRRKRRGF